MSKRRHIFISHHFADDDSVARMSSMLSRGGWDIRNSSIRLKQANQQRIDRGEIADSTLKRLLRMKISWASSVVVLIGNQTHTRPWVGYEIDEAHRQGKPIIGVYARGCRDAELPPALEQYATSIVAWNLESIMQAIDGDLTAFQTPDGDERQPPHEMDRGSC